MKTPPCFLFCIQHQTFTGLTKLLAAPSQPEGARIEQQCPRIVDTGRSRSLDLFRDGPGFGQWVARRSHVANTNNNVS